MLQHLTFCHHVGAKRVYKDDKTQPDEMLSDFRSIQIFQDQAGTEDQQVHHGYLFIPFHGFIIKLLVYQILFFLSFHVFTTVER